LAINLDNLDFNLEALFLWIRLTFTDLSKAEKADVKFLAEGVRLVSLMIFFKDVSRFLLRIVLILSFLTFLIALFMIGIVLGMVT